MVQNWYFQTEDSEMKLNVWQYILKFSLTIPFLDRSLYGVFNDNIQLLISEYLGPAIQRGGDGGTHTV